MLDLASRVGVMATLAFGLWIGLLRVLRHVENPVAGLLAAVLSWAVASLSAGWLIAMLHHMGFWPHG